MSNNKIIAWFVQRRRSIAAFAGVGLLAFALTFTALTLMRNENPLEIAARNSDTITINMTYNQRNQTIIANQTVQFRNRTGQSLNEVKFHIYANAFRQGLNFPAVSQADTERAFPNGPSYGGIIFHWVKVAGIPVQIIITGCEENVLKVPLASPLADGQEVVIVMDYTVQLANIRHRLGWTDNAVNLGNFYPAPVMFQDGEWMDFAYSYNGDPFFNALHNFHVTINAPRTFTVASSGIVENIKYGQDTRITTLSARAIRDFALVLSDRFQVKSQIVNRVEVRYYWIDDADPVRSHATAVRALQTFSRLFVAYPYQKLSVVQTDFLHGGMEFGKLVYISMDIQYREDIDRVIVHEIAHQWWYGIIGNDQARVAWIDEGLAEFSTMLFFEENPDFNVSRGDFVTMMRQSLTTYISFINSTLGVNVNTDMNRDLHGFMTTYEYFYMVYARGLLLFYDLERLVGRGTMRTALADLARTHKFGIVTPDSLITSFERTTGAQLGLFFDSFLRGNNFLPA